MAEPGRAQRRRALADPIHGQGSVCFETHRLQQLVVLGADELATCRNCFDAATRFGRLSGGHPILVRLGTPAVTCTGCHSEVTVDAIAT